MDTEKMLTPPKPGCKKASLYMMKYMDGVITESEAEWLNKHIAVCSECKESFMVYDMMMDEFAEIELIAAPDNLVSRVMAAVDELPTPRNVLSASASSATDNLIYAVWGVFSIIFGFGFLLFMNREQIIASMEGNDAFAVYLRIVKPVSAAVTSFTGSLQAVFTSSLASAASFFSSYGYLLLGIAAACAIMQYVLKTRKGNLGVAYADEKTEHKD